jgi:TPR repeat protein
MVIAPSDSPEPPMNRLVLALTLVVATFSSGTLAQQRPPHFPQKYRDTDAPTLIVKAKAGDSEAMLWLAIRLSNGRDLPKDDTQALAWFHKAADLGQSSGMFFVGVANWNGSVVTQDFVEAYKWLDLSAKYGNETERDRAVSARDSLARVMSAQTIAQSKAREADWEKDFPKRKKS